MVPEASVYKIWLDWIVSERTMVRVEYADTIEYADTMVRVEYAETMVRVEYADTVFNRKIFWPKR